MAKKKHSLVEEIASLPPRKRRTFLDMLEPDQMQELLELRAAYQDGKIPSHVKVSAIHRKLVERFGIAICSDHLRKWLNGETT